MKTALASQIACRLFADKMWMSRVERSRMAGATGLEPAASCVTGRRSNQLNYAPNLFSYLSRKSACLSAFLRFNRFACVACFNHRVPHTVVFGSPETKIARVQIEALSGSKFLGFLEQRSMARFLTREQVRPDSQNPLRKLGPGRHCCRYLAGLQTLAH